MHSILIKIPNNFLQVFILYIQVKLYIAFLKISIIGQDNGVVKYNNDESTKKFRKKSFLTFLFEYRKFDLYFCLYRLNKHAEKPLNIFIDMEYQWSILKCSL